MMNWEAAWSVFLAVVGLLHLRSGWVGDDNFHLILGSILLALGLGLLL